MKFDNIKHIPEEINKKYIFWFLVFSTCKIISFCLCKVFLTSDYSFPINKHILIKLYFIFIIISRLNFKLGQNLIPPSTHDL